MRGCYDFDLDLTNEVLEDFQTGTYRGLYVVDFFRPSSKNPKRPFTFIKPAIAQTTGIRGWKVGDPIRNLTRKGNIPSWSTVRARYWKNKAEWVKTNSNHDYLPNDIKRMENGLAPQKFNEIRGMWESKELHHDPAQRNGGLFDFIEVWPDQHAIIDPNRHTGG